MEIGQLPVHVVELTEKEDPPAELALVLVPVPAPMRKTV
jgi:hypothetical protein